MSLNVSLPPEIENRVRAHVASGMFGSASEVVREALRLFESYQSVQGATLVALKADIEQGQADKRAGRVAELDVNAIKAAGKKMRTARANA
jgi:antitoxin ParD1/3/4